MHTAPQTVASSNKDFQIFKTSFEFPAHGCRIQNHDVYNGKYNVNRHRHGERNAANCETVRCRRLESTFIKQRQQEVNVNGARLGIRTITKTR